MCKESLHSYLSPEGKIKERISDAILSFIWYTGRRLDNDSYSIHILTGCVWNRKDSPTG